MSLANARGPVIEVSRENRTIAVSASGKASAIADVAVVTVGFEVHGMDEQDAYARGLQRSNDIMDAMLMRGVPKAHIESSTQSLHAIEESEWKKKVRPAEGMRYSLSQSWSVRVSPEEAAGLLDSAITAGANRSGSITWRVRDLRRLQTEAAGQALERAREIAERMARGLNTTLADLLYASNDIPRDEAEFGMLMRRAPASPVVKPLALAAPTLEELANVYAVFAIE